MGHLAHTQTLPLPCKQAPSKGGKICERKLRIPQAKQVRESTSKDDLKLVGAVEPVDIVFDVQFHPLVISLLQICQEGN